MLWTAAITSLHHKSWDLLDYDSTMSSIDASTFRDFLSATVDNFSVSCLVGHASQGRQGRASQGVSIFLRESIALDPGSGPSTVDKDQENKNILLHFEGDPVVDCVARVISPIKLKVLRQSLSPPPPRPKPVVIGYTERASNIGQPYHP